MTKPKIGFIGLGLMGAAMVERLQNKGHTLVVLGNVRRDAIDAALARGATEARSAKDLAAECDIVMMCMDNSKSVESRMRGEQGVIAGLRPGTIVIDCGTSLPSSTKALAAEVAAVGATYLDAPLGRTPAHAIQGKLNIMGAGDRAAFDKVKPVLDDVGENVFYLGPSGTGHTIKLINNFYSMTCASATAECFAMADKAGVDRQAVYDVMSAGPLHSGMMDFVAAYGLEGIPDKLAFAIKNGAKDVRYYAQLARDNGTESAISAAVLGEMDKAIDTGFGDHYVAQMLDYFNKAFND